MRIAHLLNYIRQHLWPMNAIATLLKQISLGNYREAAEVAAVSRRYRIVNTGKMLPECNRCQSNF